MSVSPTHLLCPKCGTKVEKYLNPFPTVDVIIRYESGVVLIKRKNPPYGWAIPGGFVNYNESTETTAVREMREETGLELKNLELFTVRSNPARDPRFHTITVIYTADGIGEIVAGDDAAEAHVFHFDKLPEKMAFDHRDILDEYCNVKV